MLETNKDTTGKLPSTFMDNLSQNLRHARLLDLPHIFLVKRTGYSSGPVWSISNYSLPCLPCLETLARSNSEPDENTTRALALILPDTKFE